MATPHPPLTLYLSTLFIMVHNNGNLPVVERRMSDIGFMIEDLNKLRKRHFWIGVIFIMKTYRMTVQGMTCTGCEQHVARALGAIGAKLMDVSFQRGEVVFALPEDTDVDMARQAVQNAHYEPGDIFRLFLG